MSGHSHTRPNPPKRGIPGPPPCPAGPRRVRFGTRTHTLCVLQMGLPRDSPKYKLQTRHEEQCRRGAASGGAIWRRCVRVCACARVRGARAHGPCPHVACMHVVCAYAKACVSTLNGRSGGRPASLAACMWARLAALLRDDGFASPQGGCALLLARLRFAPPIGCALLLGRRPAAPAVAPPSLRLGRRSGARHTRRSGRRLQHQKQQQMLMLSSCMGLPTREFSHTPTSSG